MSTYTAELLWERGDQDFAAGKYSRRHAIRFDGGLQVTGSSAPQSVPLPWSDPAGMDPEEALVASLSSCHMLWFLAIAAKRGFVVDRYADSPVGLLERNAERRLAITVVTLKPAVVFSADRQPTPEELEQLHHKAHDECYIANSVKSEVKVEPVL